MHRRQNRRVLLGTLLLVGLVVVGGLIFFLDKLAHAFEGRTRIVAVLPEARNLRAGAQVWIGGKEVGRVASIEFMPRGDNTRSRLAVTLEIETDARELVRVGSRARITSDRFIGEPVVDIVPAGPSAPVLPAGDSVYARPTATGAPLKQRSFMLLAALDSLNAQARLLRGPAQRYEANVARLQLAFARVQRESAELSAAARESPLLSLMADTAWSAAVDRLAATMRAISGTLDTAGTMHTQNLTQVRASFGALKARADALTLEADRLRALMSASGSLARFSRDSAIIHALHGVQAQLDSLMTEARRNPMRFVF